MSAINGKDDVLYVKKEKLHIIIIKDVQKISVLIL